MQSRQPNILRGSALFWVTILFLNAACTIPAVVRTITEEGVPDDALPPPDSVVAQATSDAVSPKANDGSDLPWPAAPLLENIQILPNRDSLVISVPAVEGVQDYRAFVLTDELTVFAESDGTENLSQTTAFCAGYRQFNDTPQENPTILRQIELSGVQKTVRIVVEALDVACPFTGLRATSKKTIDVVHTGLSPEDRQDLDVFPESDIKEQYQGLMIINGHRASETLGTPAPWIAPKVLARTTFEFEPGLDEAAPATFFADFQSNDDPPTYVRDDEQPRIFRGEVWQNSKFTFYAYGTDLHDIFVDRGTLKVLLADWGQDIFSHVIAYPRQTFALSDNNYLRVDFEVNSNATARRYWWLGMCGSDATDDTLSAETGELKSPIVKTSFFYQPDGRNPSVAGWNCLQVFPRDGWPFALEPDDTRPQSDIRVMVNTANAPERGSVVNVSPDQYDNTNIARPGWFRQQTGDGSLAEPIIDDQLLISPRTKYRLFIRRDRLVLYVNGEQRLCNDFPNHALTMAEGVVGFGQVLYHSEAERHEFYQSFNDRSGQKYYIENAPFADQRTWDNIGVEEGVGLGTGFDESQCYVHDG